LAEQIAVEIIEQRARANVEGWGDKGPWGGATVTAESKNGVDIDWTSYHTPEG
jgi:hypothetical protein